MELTISVYSLTKSFPSNEKFNLISQIQRSAISVPSNIAEGSGRSSKKEFQHFLSVSMGSLYELETQMIIASELGFLKKEQLTKFEEKIIVIQKMTYKLHKSLGS